MQPVSLLVRALLCALALADCIGAYAAFELDVCMTFTSKSVRLIEHYLSLIIIYLPYSCDFSSLQSSPRRKERGSIALLN
jgi:hypothetical protein